MHNNKVRPMHQVYIYTDEKPVSIHCHWHNVPIELRIHIVLPVPQIYTELNASKLAVMAERTMQVIE